MEVNVWKLILCGIVVHFILFYSIFDMYFTTPLVHGMTPHTTPRPPPARRLVLFVADGLRADRFFEPDPEGRSRAPYLRNVMETEGGWGISHTRVPTESRPGHVALIAGFYEDVSAVAKGWKENPVEFDSVFNETQYTWSWGSPDILPMFAKGASGDHVFTHSYSAEEEDFAGSDPSTLDTWVFERVREFLDKARKDAALMAKLKADKVVIFLHLLGMDTNGHSNKPHSEAYMKNIKLLDSGIDEMVKLFTRFYDNDRKTAFVFTSDHGMTDWGSHGAGEISETHTPLVVWGAGLRRPELENSCGSYRDDFCKVWGTEHLRRYDVQQADVAALMAYLLGVPFPVNSVGVLPLDLLDAGQGEKAEAFFTNAKQILEQFQVKMLQMKEKSIGAFFRPFPDLLPSRQADYLRDIKSLIHAGQFDLAISETEELIQTALRGLSYYQTYDRYLLGFSVVCGFLGWMMYVLLLVLAPNWAEDKEMEIVRPLVFSVFGFVAACLLYIQSLPWTYYLYCLMPFILWYKVTSRWGVMMQGVRQVWEAGRIKVVLAAVVSTLVALEILVLGFFHRELLSCGLVGMAVWPHVTGLSVHKVEAWFWSISCLALAVFPLLPVVGGTTHYSLVFFGGIVFLALVFSISCRLRMLGITSKKQTLIFGIQGGLLASSLLVKMWAVSQVEAGQGVPLFCNVFSWLSLVTAPVPVVHSSTKLPLRLMSLTLALLSPYLLLSITYEVLFILALSCVLFAWVAIEFSTNPSQQVKLTSVDFRETGPRLDKAWLWRDLQLSDLRRGLFVVYLLMIGFFGTGNIASINSFNPSSVLPFVSVFSPFIMGGLMMIKNMIPFIMVTCAFQGVNVVTRVPMMSIFLLVFLMTDFMGLHFFFLVRDSGSWLEIGTSISHYVIVMTTIIVLMLLVGLSRLLTRLWFPRLGSCYCLS